MTREERIAAGWTECWGIFDWASEAWKGLTMDSWVGRGGRKQDYGSANLASFRAAEHSRGKVVARRFWRRKKGRELKLGDEVTLKGKVSFVGDDSPVPHKYSYVVVYAASGSPALRVETALVEKVKP